MDSHDKPELKIILDALSECYQKPQLSEMALNIYYAALNKFSMDQIRFAVNAHLADTKDGQFFPKPANFIKHLVSPEIKITADRIIAEARLANTPLGIRCRIQIGHYDLDTADAFYLKQRAQECIALIDSWREDWDNGIIPDHVHSICEKYNVNVLAPFSEGYIQPPPGNRLENHQKAINSERHLQLMAPAEEVSEEIDPEGHKKIQALIGGVLNEGTSH